MGKDRNWRNCYINARENQSGNLVNNPETLATQGTQGQRQKNTAKITTSKS